MKKRVGAIEEFSFEPLTLMGSSLQAHRNVKQLHITIAVTGWLNETHSGNGETITYHYSCHRLAERDTFR